MKNLLGSLSFYHRGEEPIIFLLHYAPLFDDAGKYMGDGCWGDLERVELRAFEKVGLEMVQKSLREFPTRRRKFGAIDKQGFDLWPPARRRKFFKEYSDLNLSLQENGDFWLYPMRPYAIGSSGIGDDQSRVVIPHHASQLEFFTAVMSAFRKLCRT